jgi:hypothetical protein
VPVPLSPIVARRPAADLAESILAPSHRVAEGVEGVRRGELSRMGDWSEVMTVRQWLDIVAYVRSLAEMAS